MGVLERVRELGIAQGGDGHEDVRQRRRELRDRLKRGLVERLGLSEVAALVGDGASELVREELAVACRAVLNEDGFSELDADERDGLVRQVIDEVVGLGPLQPLLDDPTISEVMVNGCASVYYERDGRILPARTTFDSPEQVMLVMDRILAPLGRRLDDASPIVNARLSNGYRVNAVIAPVAMDGPAVTIRKFSGQIRTLESLVGLGSLPTWFSRLLSWAVRLRQDIAVAGGTGSGKTTLLNAISLYIPHEERIITIEDTPELRLNQPHVIRMETRDANVEGKGLITYRDLVTNALRQRPDRIIVGECRDAAAFDMLQAMTTGHDGSLTTIHADNCREVPVRLRTLVQQANTGMSSREILEYISQAIDFIIYTERSHGVRRVTEIAEVQGMQGDVVTIAPIVRFEHDPNDPEHSGWFVPTGERFMRRHIEKMANEGVYVNDDWFNPQAVF